MEGLCCLYNFDAEERGVQEYVGFAHIRFVWRLIFRIDGVVDGLGRQFSMQLTWLAVESGAVVVKDAVGDIGGLLYLNEFDASADGMDAP